MSLNFGIKISEEGKDVFDANDRELIFKTNSKPMKEVSSGSVSLTSEWTEISHNLGYVPQFLVYINDKTAGKTYLSTGSQSFGLARADTSKIYIKRINASGDTAFYYIFYEDA